MSSTVADFRSDTVTKPCKLMRHAIANAEVGDDVFGDDPSVLALERKVAELTGKEAALFLSSGTQSNLTALLSHCQRGDEYIAGQEAHTYKYEAGGAAVLGGIQPQPIEFEDNRTLDLSKVQSKIKVDDAHFAKTRLLCIENTQSGFVLPQKYHSDVNDFTNTFSLASHLDGARLFNAIVKQKISIIDITQYYDSVSLCLSKGLGAPAGSVLCGKKDFIQRAHRWRKMLGGGMRQSGILAAAGMFALDHNIDRLEIDHKHAKILATELNKLPGVSCDVNSIDTNIFYLHVHNEETAIGLQKYLYKNDIHITTGNVIRFVTHLDISPQMIQKTIDICSHYLLKK